MPSTYKVFNKYICIYNASVMSNSLQPHELAHQAHLSMEFSSIHYNVKKPNLHFIHSSMVQLLKERSQEGKEGGRKKEEKRERRDEGGKEGGAREEKGKKEGRRKREGTDRRERGRKGSNKVRRKMTHEEKSRTQLIHFNLCYL